MTMMSGSDPVSPVLEPGAHVTAAAVTVTVTVTVTAAVRVHPAPAVFASAQLARLPGTPAVAGAHAAWAGNSR
jgi:hypothetical protein